MTPERWQKVEEVLQATLDRSPRDRVSYLDEACAGDDELKAEAASLISAYEEAGDFIEQPAIAADAHIFVGALDRQIGRDVGAYTILERLGAGGMGEVYLAHDQRLNRRVALKILPAFFASDDMRLRRFQREAQAASALNHPNILTIHEVGEHDDIRFIATEFIEGQTIRELIAQGDLTAAEILDIAVQIASALAAAHAAGIVHRDIKPENIMRRADGLVKILDFGIVKLMEQPSAEAGEGTSLTQTHTEMGVVMGTAGYMSPEQARGLTVDERTDIWSLGVVLYEMLAHRAPFSGATRMDTMVGILEREPPPLFSSGKPLPELETLKRIVQKTLRKDRDERYQTALELAAELKSARHELSPLMEKESVVDVLRASGRQDLTQQHMVQPGSQPLSEHSMSRSGHAVSSVAIVRELSEVPALTGRKESRRNIFRLVGAAVLLISVLAGTCLYRRAVTPPARQTSAAEATGSTAKLYARMNETEQLAFIRDQEQRISAMMGDRPAKLNEEALRAIKAKVDLYAARAGRPGDETLSPQYERAAPYIPLIARSFTARKVPVIIGIYLPMIESAYRPCFESSLGAKGLFQFLPQTARRYGVSHDEMCNVEKMTPAAAAYIADHMAELGDDAESMTLVLLSYNRGATWVRGTLRELRDRDDYERNFWTLFAHRDRLDDSFRTESAGYVPSFFAAAIIGENPGTFGLQMPPLSTLTGGSV